MCSTLWRYVLYYVAISAMLCGDACFTFWRYLLYIEAIRTLLCSDTCSTLIPDEGELNCTQTAMFAAKCSADVQ